MSASTRTILAPSASSGFHPAAISPVRCCTPQRTGATVVICVHEAPRGHGDNQETSMPVKVIFFLKRKAGLTPQQFRTHYENSHVKLAQKYIGHLVVAYKRNYPQFAT